MHVSQKCQYALRALFELAKRRDAGPITAAQIAEVQAIPTRFLEVILQGLRARGIVDSHRGNNGGYVIAVAPEMLTVGDIVRSVDGSLGPVSCVSGPHDSHCRLKGRCAFMGLWQKAHQAIQQVYDTTSLQDLIDDEQPAEDRDGSLMYVV